jgi:hypothetical protein
MQDTEEIAQRLHAMVDGGAPQPMETRSIENPNVPITPEQLSMIWGYGPTRSGVQINEHTALTYSAVFAAVKILAESIGMLPLAVFQGDDDEDVRTRAKDHPAYPLLRWEANPEMTAVVFKEAVQANLTSWGNGYAKITPAGPDSFCPCSPTGPTPSVTRVNSATTSRAAGDDSPPRRSSTSRASA